MFRTGDLLHIPQGVVLYTLTDDQDRKSSFFIREDATFFFEKRIMKPTLGVYLGKKIVKRYHDVNIDGGEYYLFDDELEKMNIARGDFHAN
jgi:hypothetical protein